jgi:hypothetical protein
MVRMTCLNIITASFTACLYISLMYTELSFVGVNECKSVYINVYCISQQTRFGFRTGLQTRDSEGYPTGLSDI